MQVSSEIGAKNVWEPLADYLIKFSYNRNSYCMVMQGQQSQGVAWDMCKNLNATLPLPKSRNEASALKKITGWNGKWIGVRDLTRGGIKAFWKDVNGYSIGNEASNVYASSVYVNLRVKISSLSLFYVNSESAKSGASINLEDTEQVQWRNPVVREISTFRTLVF